MTRVMIQPMAILILLCFLAPALGAVQHKEVRYTDGDTELVGYLYWNDALEDQRPGVMVVHEWWGLNEYARQRAEMLAALGYVAFAVDMYGKDRVTEHPDEAKLWMQQITENTDAWQKRPARVGDTQGARTGRPGTYRRHRLLFRRCHRHADGLCGRRA